MNKISVGTLVLMLGMIIAIFFVQAQHYVSLILIGLLYVGSFLVVIGMREVIRVRISIAQRALSVLSEKEPELPEGLGKLKYRDMVSLERRLDDELLLRLKQSSPSAYSVSDTWCNSMSRIHLQEKFLKYKSTAEALGYQFLLSPVSVTLAKTVDEDEFAETFKINQDDFEAFRKFLVGEHGISLE